MNHQAGSVNLFNEHVSTKKETEMLTHSLNIGPRTNTLQDASPGTHRSVSTCVNSMLTLSMHTTLEHGMTGPYNNSYQHPEVRTHP